MKPKVIAIIGLGLMGGSLAAACRKRFPRSRIIGISRSLQALRYARQKKWVHEATQDFESGAAAADLVVLATPVDQFVRYLVRLDRIARPGTLVTDVGSVKGRLLDWYDSRNWKRIEFAGAHPMAGSHLRGVAAAAPGLYDGTLTFIVRPRKIRPQSYARIKQFWCAISGRIAEVGRREHDRTVAQISHLPHAVAACLVLSASQRSLKFAATGFCDSTRIAKGSPSVWLPIFQWNRPAVLEGIRDFEKNISAFKEALRANRPGKLRRFLSLAARRRGQI